MKQTWKPAYPIADLEPHPDNPRRGDVEAIGESIDAHGFYGAVLVQESRGRIIAGEHRWRAAQAKGMTKLPVVLIDCDDDEAKRIMLADNKLADSAGYDDATLASLLASLDDLTGTGYTDDEMAMLAADATVPNFAPVDETGQLDVVTMTTCPECGHSWVK